MIDYQRTIDNIRSILASTKPPSKENVAVVALEYSTACEAVNERLGKSGQLLRDGLRSEAIQQCEMEPNVLGLVATLDFPELPAWVALLQLNGLDAPPPLLVDVAADLNEAYAQEQPLMTLLRRHRLLALSRSPLRDRIVTLRKLATLDANNAVWRDDLRVYEQTRQQEIRRAVEQEYKQGNVVALEELTHDVRSSDWLEPPPAGLVQQVSDAHARLVRQRARSELPQLELQLNEAFAQCDAGRGRNLRDRWNKCASLAHLSQDDALYERAAPALEWLDQQERAATDQAAYDANVAELERALNDGEGIGDLQNRAYAILKSERPIPPALEQRLRNRVADLKVAKSRRIRMVVTAVTVVVALAGAGIGYAIVSRRHAEQLATHINTVETLIEQKKHAEAQQYLDQLATSAPGLASDPEIQKLSGELAKWAREEQARRENFRSLIEAAEQAGDEQPDRKALEAASLLATSNQEKARVQKLRNMIAEADRRRQLERDQNFSQQLAELNGRIDALDQVKPDEQVLTEIYRAIVTLIARSSDISAEPLDLAKKTQERTEGLRKSIERQNEMEASLARIDRHVGTHEDFKRELEQFVGAFPGSAQEADFTRVIAEASLWNDIDAWNRFIEQWHMTDVAHLDTAHAKQMLDAATEILSDHDGHPAARELQRRLPYLEAMCRRADGGSLQGSLNELFTDSLVAGLWMVETTDDKRNVTRYYMIAPPPEASERNSLQVAYILDFSRTAKHRKQIPINEITYKGQAPQSIVAKKSMDELAKLKDALWESVFTKLITIIYSDKQLEPVLKVLFLQKVLDVASQGSESVAVAFAPFKEVLGSVEIDSAAPWMDWKNENAQHARTLALDLLNRLPALQHLKEEVATNLKSFRSSIGVSYDCIGWLARDMDGKWQCHLTDRASKNCALMVAQPKADAGFTWAAIGHVESGKVVLDRLNSSSLVQGRPVFAIKSHSGTN